MLRKPTLFVAGLVLALSAGSGCVGSQAPGARPGAAAALDRTVLPIT
jgi:hypothetical protein